MPRIIAIILGLALALGVGFLLGTAEGSKDQEAPAPVETYDPFLQKNFPCAEDDVLGYDPSFDPDKVGCIHVEGDTLERP